MMYLYRSGSPGTIRIGIQGVTQSSDNQGYVNNGTFLTYVDLTGTAISTSPSLQLFTFASPISLSAGTYAVVFKNESGLFNGSNRCIVASTMAVNTSGTIGEIGGNNSSSTSTGGTVQSYCSMRGALRTYGYPYATFTSIIVTTPNQLGNKIRLTANSAGYYDVSGIISRLTAAIVGCSLKIYDDTLTEIGSISLPNNQGATQRLGEFYFTSPVRLYPDRDYYVVCAGTQQSNYYTLLAQSDNSAFTAHDFQYCSRATASGAFTMTSGRVAELGLIIEDQTTVNPAYIPTERNASTITIAPGSTSQSIELYLGATGLTASTSGLSARYNRTRTASVDIPLVARVIDGTAPTGGWIAGGFAEVDSVNMPGVYRLDLPDAALAAGADDVTVVVRGASGTNGAVMTIKLSSGGLTGAQTATAVWGASVSGYTSASEFGGVINETRNVVDSTPTLVWDEFKVDHTTPGTFGDYLDTKVSTGADTSRIQLRQGPFLIRQNASEGLITEVNQFLSTVPNIEIVLIDSSGGSVSVSGSTLVMRVRNQAGTAVVNNITPTVAYADGGVIRWTPNLSWTALGVTTAGTYRIVVERTMGTVTTTFGPFLVQLSSG
jgi:hypothetical protein